MYSLLTDNYKCILSTFLKSCRPSPYWPKTQFCLYTLLRTLNMKYKCQVFFHDLPLRAEVLHSGCKVVCKLSLKLWWNMTINSRTRLFASGVSNHFWVKLFPGLNREWVFCELLRLHTVNARISK